MKIGVLVSITGSSVLILGIIFSLQGLSVIGPESSFMYSSRQWIDYGIQITCIGAIIAVTGIILHAYAQYR